MLKVRITLEDHISSFLCPFCGIDDVAYITMPHSCWKCSGIYIFDLSELRESVDKRYIYYKYGKA